MTDETQRTPHLIVLGGPNGAGKSTAASLLIPESLGDAIFVNADQIAAGLSGFSPDDAAFSAGRIMVERLDELIRHRQSFAFESTLSGRNNLRRLQSARDAGYTVWILYLWVTSVELSLARVRQRVIRGGHDVPEAAVRRRYPKSISNFYRLYRPLADWWKVYDNSRIEPRLLAEGQGAEVDQVLERDRWQQFVKEAGHE